MPLWLFSLLCWLVLIMNPSPIQCQTRNSLVTVSNANSSTPSPNTNGSSSSSQTDHLYVAIILGSLAVLIVVLVISIIIVRKSGTNDRNQYSPRTLNQNSIRSQKSLLPLSANNKQTHTDFNDGTTNSAPSTFERKSTGPREWESITVGSDPEDGIYQEVPTSNHDSQQDGKDDHRYLNIKNSSRGTQQPSPLNSSRPHPHHPIRAFGLNEPTTSKSTSPGRIDRSREHSQLLALSQRIRELEHKMPSLKQEVELTSINARLFEQKASEVTERERATHALPGQLPSAPVIHNNSAPGSDLNVVVASFLENETFSHSKYHPTKEEDGKRKF